MQHITRPVIVMPPVYEISMNLRRWCRFGEVMEVAKNCAHIGRVELEMTIPNLLRRYASLVRRNSHGGAHPGKKIFRYSLDGLELRGQEIPDNLPFAEFVLPIGETTFVTEEWTRDLLNMIRRGCFETREYSDMGIFGIRETGGHCYIERLDHGQSK